MRDKALDIYILAAQRSAIGGFGGALAGLEPEAVVAPILAASLRAAEVLASEVEHVVMGHVINTLPRDMYLSRVAAMQAGIPDTTPAMNVNRLCGSGAQAVVSVVQSLMLGDASIGVAAGAEVMSRAPYILPSMRFGQKMGEAQALDMMLGALTCPFGTGHMGITAENVARDYGISRAAQDAFALESQRRAAQAIAESRFARQITPIEIETRRGLRRFDQDEHPKSTSLEALAALKPAFQKGGTVTAGNASGINDGAAAVVLARGARVGQKPRARILGYAHAGVDPKVMGLGPIPAVSKLCARLGMRPSDFDLVESNEAFAAQAIAVSRELGLNPQRVNPNGGAIALGHPVGATGVILVVKALHELERADLSTALITMCIGGGQGIALAIERV